MSTQRVDYAFSNSGPQAGRQLSSLEQYLDPMTVACLNTLVQAHSAMRCLELGPGRGTIAHWLLDRVGPAGRVTTIDRDPSQVPPADGLQIMRHDLQEGLPVPGPFDLIHARMVLLHLPNRAQLLHQLVDGLAPAGWLVVGEFRSARPPDVVTSYSAQDTELFTRIVTQTLDLLGGRYGLDNLWGDRVGDAMADTGLQDVTVAAHDGTWIGGGPGCGLFSACARQKHDELIAGGLTDEELQRFYALLADPRFSTRAWQFVCVSGQKPGDEKESAR